MDDSLIKGNLVRWNNGSEAIGAVRETLLHGKRVVVHFDNGEKHEFPAVGDGLEHLKFTEGHNVELVGQNLIGSVVGVARHDGRYSYKIRTASGETKTVLEDGLRPAIIENPIEKLRLGELDSARSTNLKVAATRLAFANEFDELSSLSNSRVEIKPHQVGVVHRVMSSWPHRFILADEVGLGKTIEAGLIIKELKARGLAKRVLILAPSGLVHQWQFEMKTKFNEVFSRYDGAVLNYQRSRGQDENPWTLENNVIASSGFATWNDDRSREIALAGWDLVIIDEAHHARRSKQAENKYTTTKLYRLAAALNDPNQGGASSCLLLTATPMQLDAFELFSMIELLDPVLFPSEKEFSRHVDSLAGLNELVERFKRWEGLEPDEQALLRQEVEELQLEPALDFESQVKTHEGRDELERNIIDRHRLSEVMVRNRKSVVGGFQPRVATTWTVELTDEERIAYDAVTEYVRSGFDRANRQNSNAIGFLMTTFQKLLASSTAALRSTMSRRIEKLTASAAQKAPSTPVAIPEEGDLDETDLEVALSDVLAAEVFEATMEECRELEAIIGFLDQIPIDSKTLVLRDRLAKEIAAQDDQAKVIIFTQFRNTQSQLRKVLEDTDWTVHEFHGGLKPAEKDQVVDDFRTGGGLQALVTTEAGGEGRNFQFCHMLVNYDLPWNPMKVEQRIGRVDRIGQKHPVKIFNFSTKDTVEERVVKVLTERIRIFTETVGGLDPILGGVERSLNQMLSLAADEQQAKLAEFEKQIEVRVHHARLAEEQRADFIMDTRSYRQDEVDALLDRRGVTSNDDLMRFVLGALAELGCRIESDPELENVYSVTLGHPFGDLFPKYFEEDRTRRVTFNPSVALDFETVEFYAFGHEVVDLLVERARSKEYHGSASIRRIFNDEIDPVRGWLFIYTIELDGVVSHREMLPIFIREDGESDDAVARLLLERTTRIKREEFGSPVSTEVGDGYDEAVSQAERVAIERLMDQQADLSDQNSRRLEKEESRLAKFYDYKEEAAQLKLDRSRETLDRLSGNPDPDVQKILPVWAKNVKDARDMVDRLTDEREDRLAALSGRENVSASHTLLAASRVEVWPDPKTTFETVGDLGIPHSLRRLGGFKSAAGLRELAAEVRARSRQLAELGKNYTFDHGTATSCVEKLEDLLERAVGFDAYGRFLVVGAARYFLEVDDGTHDLKDPEGFHDDLAVIEAVESKVGQILPDPVDSGIDWDLVDEDCRELAREAIKLGAPDPEIGFEVEGGDYILEVAWPDHRIAILVDEGEACPEGWQAQSPERWTVAALAEAISANDGRE